MKASSPCSFSISYFYYFLVLAFFYLSSVDSFLLLDFTATLVANTLLKLTLSFLFTSAVALSIVSSSFFKDSLSYLSLSGFLSLENNLTSLF